MEATLQSPLGQTILEPGVVTIGSTPDSRLIVHDAKASPHHAVLRPTEQGYTITDWSSTYGTFVNDEQLYPLVPRLLTAGDRIRIGEMVFTYEVHEGAALVVGPGSRPQGELAASAVPYEYMANAVDAQLPSASLTQTQYGSAPYQLPDAPPAAPSSIPAYGVAPPPPPTYTPPSSQKRPGGWLKIALIAVAALVVLAGAGFGAFLLTRPQPVISITSGYKVDSTPAGATGTVFHVSGKQFSNNSTITFLLDGTPVSGERLGQSDANGNVKTDLTVTSDWAVGHHTLTAKDAENYVTKAGVAVVIVPQGQAHTPGPNGAPPDNMSFVIKATVKATDTAGYTINPWTDTLTITGRPDPAGGSVSINEFDNGQPHTSTGDFGNGLTYTETLTYTGSGTYKMGHLSYTETVTSMRIVLSDGGTCVLKSPWMDEHLDGTFSNQNTISGTYNNDAYSIPCSDGTTIYHNAQTGTWTGALDQSGTTSDINSPVQVGFEAIWTKPFAWA